MASIINTLARKDIELDQSEFGELFQVVVSNARTLQDELIHLSHKAAGVFVWRSFIQ
jgi:hypothetical protein